MIVRALRSSAATIVVSAQPLDGLRCKIPVCSGDDSERSWSRAMRGVLELENVAYYDSHWLLSRTTTAAMASKRRKRRRKKTGFTIHTRADRAPHRDYQLERERSKPAYQLDSNSSARITRKKDGDEARQSTNALAAAHH